jgi:hypothetical protein
MKTSTGTTRASALAALIALTTTIAACGGGGDDDEAFSFTSPEKDYTVAFPAGEPDHEELQAPLPQGGSVPIDMFMSEDGDRAYGAGRAEYQQAPPDPVASLEGARDGAVRQLNGELKDSRMIELQGRPGIEFAIGVTSGGEEGTSFSRFYLDDNVMYQVVVAGPGEFGATTDDDVETFLESFRFTDA